MTLINSIPISIRLLQLEHVLIIANDAVDSSILQTKFNDSIQFFVFFEDDDDDSSPQTGTVTVTVNVWHFVSFHAVWNTIIMTKNHNIQFTSSAQLVSPHLTVSQYTQYINLTDHFINCKIHY